MAAAAEATTTVVAEDHRVEITAAVTEVVVAAEAVIPSGGTSREFPLAIRRRGIWRRRSAVAV